MKELVGDGRYGLLLDGTYKVTALVDTITQETFEITKQELFEYCEYIKVLGLYITNDYILEKLLDFDFKCHYIRYTSQKEVTVDDKTDMIYSTTKEPQVYNIVGKGEKMFITKNSNPIKVNLSGSVGYVRLGENQASTSVKTKDLIQGENLIVKGYPNCKTAWYNSNMGYLTLYSDNIVTELKDCSVGMFHVGGEKANISIDSCHFEDDISIDNACKSLSLFINNSQLDTCVHISGSVHKTDITLSNTSINFLEIRSIRNLNFVSDKNTKINFLNIALTEWDLGNKWNIETGAHNRVTIDITDLSVTEVLLNHSGFRKLLGTFSESERVELSVTKPSKIIYEKLKNLAKSYNITVI